MHIKLHDPEDLTQLQQQSRQQRDAKQRDRYRTVLLAIEGHDAPAIARTLGRRRRPERSRGMNADNRPEGGTKIVSRKAAKTAKKSINRQWNRRRRPKRSRGINADGRRFPAPPGRWQIANRQ